VVSARRLTVNYDEDGANKQLSTTNHSCRMDEASIVIQIAALSRRGEKFLLTAQSPERLRITLS